MFSTLHKKLVWAIVIWFAAMQMISPLMHAHVEKDSPAQGVGMHMHTFETAVEKVATFKNTQINFHIIGVDQALVKDIQLIMPPVLAILFFLLVLSVSRTYLKPTTCSFTKRPFYLRPDSRPRAPPLF